jgi:hypothetical protein
LTSGSVGNINQFACTTAAPRRDSTTTEGSDRRVSTEPH